MIELETDNLKTLIQENSKVIVQYGAGWCGNCRMLKPKFKNLAKENTDVKFLYVDAEKFPNSRQLAKVDNLPTFASFVNGVLVNQNQGNKIEIVKDLLNEITSN